MTNKISYISTLLFVNPKT